MTKNKYPIGGLEYEIFIDNYLNNKYNIKISYIWKDITKDIFIHNNLKIKFNKKILEIIYFINNYINNIIINHKVKEINDYELYILEKDLIKDIIKSIQIILVFNYKYNIDSTII